MRHVSIEINPREAGLTPYHVRFTVEESPPVKSLLEDGFWYTQPEQEETCPPPSPTAEIFSSAFPP